MSPARAARWAGQARDAPTGGSHVRTVARSHAHTRRRAQGRASAGLTAGVNWRAGDARERQSGRSAAHRKSWRQRGAPQVAQATGRGGEESEWGGVRHEGRSDRPCASVRTVARSHVRTSGTAAGDAGNQAVGARVGNVSGGASAGPPVRGSVARAVGPPGNARADRGRTQASRKSWSGTRRRQRGRGAKAEGETDGGGGRVVTGTHIRTVARSG